MSKTIWDRLPWMKDDGHLYDANQTLLRVCSNMPFDNDIKATILADRFDTLIISRVVRLKRGEPVKYYIYVPLEPTEFIDALLPHTPITFSVDRPCFKNILLFSTLCPTKDVDALVVVDTPKIRCSLANEINNIDPWVAVNDKIEIKNADHLMKILENTVCFDLASRL